MEIAHPAHVHFFRGAYRRLTKAGHHVAVVTRDKEITDRLLQPYGIPYRCLSKPAQGTAGLMLELLSRWRNIYSIIRREGIEACVSISGISTGLPAFLARIRNIVFTDTEDAKLSNRLAFPFATEIWTPEYYLDDLGPKHRRYRGLHELAYLQGFDFEAARAERQRLGLPEKYSLVRLIAHDALHDRDITGIQVEQLRELVRKLRQGGRVYITSQGGVPGEFADEQMRFPIETMHSVLAGAQVFIGESPTMAVEAGLLGVPSFLISNRVGRLGNMIGLGRDDPGLLVNCSSWEDFGRKGPRQAELEGMATAWRKRAERYRHETEPVTDLIVKTLVGDNA
jgi:predicted glycosyltransferase